MRPADAGSEVAVLVNGLGATKYEELFCPLLRRGSPACREPGCASTRPTSASSSPPSTWPGCSLSLFWLDDELRGLHDAPASSPAYTRFGTDGTAIQTAAVVSDLEISLEGTVTAEEEGVPGAAGRKAADAIRHSLATIEAHEDELARLDAAVGDGDHGAGMVRGFTAAAAALGDAPQTARGVLQRAGRAFQDTAGGASGALVGGLLVAIGSALPSDDAASTPHAWATAIDRGLATVMRLGRQRSGRQNDDRHALSVRAGIASREHGDVRCWSGLDGGTPGGRDRHAFDHRHG